jgi:hypothetical protein
MHLCMQRMCSCNGYCVWNWICQDGCKRNDKHVTYRNVIAIHGNKSWKKNTNETECSHVKQFCQTVLYIFPLLLNAGEGPPTVQSTVVPAWNYAPQLLGKVTPTFSSIVKAARKWKKYQKAIIPNVQNTMRTQVAPMVSKYGNNKQNDAFHNQNAM